MEAPWLKRVFRLRHHRTNAGVEFKLSLECAMPWALFVVLVHTIAMLFNR
jgi:hypothetical protein